MMSASFMIISSSPSSLTSVPDHLPNSTRSPALDVERVQLAVLVARARTDGDDLAFHRLFLRRVGNEDAAGGLGFRLDTADQDAVLQWTQFHRWSPRTRICGESWHCRIASANAHLMRSGDRPTYTMGMQFDLFNFYLAAAYDD